jgi:hypothetical protein
MAVNDISSQTEKEVVTGAHRYDVSRLETLLDVIIIECPNIFEPFQYLCLDKGNIGEAA